jgi:hypothetical protein
VVQAAKELALSQEDMKRIEELFRIFGEHKCCRRDAVYDGVLSWLENAEREYDRRAFGAIVAAQNPRRHEAVLLSEQLGPGSPRWKRELGASPARTPDALADSLTEMLINCNALHLVDPHFGPENPRHRAVLEALMNVLAVHARFPGVIRVHCAAKSELSFFEREAARMAASLPSGCTIEFARWKQKPEGEKLHNRYVLTNLGGVYLGVGLDAGRTGETDDLVILPRAQYALRWSQYIDEGAFERADTPVTVRGTRTARSSKGGA